jgi:hypothetical protein
MRRSGVRSSSSPPPGHSRASHPAPGDGESLRNQRLGAFFLPATSRGVPRHPSSHCRNLCSNRKLCAVPASKLLHAPAPDPVGSHPQGHQAWLSTTPPERWRWAVPAAVRQRRLARLASGLHVPGSPQDAQPGNLSRGVTQRGPPEGRRDAAAGATGQPSQRCTEARTRSPAATVHDREADGRRPAHPRIVRGSRARVVRETPGHLGTLPRPEGDPTS